MKKLKEIISRFYTGKGFYFTAAVSLSLIALAVGAIYRASSNLISEVAYDTQKSTTVITEQAEAEKSDEKDPRIFIEETTATFTREITKAEKENTSAKIKETTEKQTTAEKKEKLYDNTSFMLPVADDILKDYSESPVYDETMGDWRVHKAIDFACERGTDVYSVGNGKVSKVYSDTAYGYCIEVDYGEFTGRYCGLEQGTTVKVNQQVKKGDIIGKTGELPCENVQEPHLHFEALKDKKNTDPLKALKR